jgi:hypothetical protein
VGLGSWLRVPRGQSGCGMTSRQGGLAYVTLCDLEEARHGELQVIRCSNSFNLHSPVEFVVIVLQATGNNFSRVDKTRINKW